MRISPVAVALLAVHGAAWGTSCGYPPPCGLILAGSVLLTGKVEEIDEGGHPDEQPLVRVRVHEALVGLSGERDIWVRQDWLKKGEEYFLDLNPDKDGDLWLGICNSSRELDSRAQGEVRQIKDLQHTNKSSIGVWLRLDGSNIEGMQVSAEGPSGTKNGTTDKDGWFFFKDLDPGRYRIRSLEEHYQPEADDAREVELLPGGCPSAYWNLHGDGVVMGTVKTETGVPVPNLRLELAEHDTIFKAASDAQGKFRFEQVKPGEYRLGTNLMEVRTASIPRNEIVPSYFEVKPGETVNGIELTIPDYGPAREIRIHVVDRDGRPVAGAYVRDATGWAPELGGLTGGDLNGLKTDANGVAIASGWEDVGYRVYAGLYQGRALFDWKTSANTEVRPGRGPIDVTLELRPLMEQSR